jgi:hypothetical protein
MREIGEWWIDDSGTALYADGDVGDMGHEAYVIDKLTQDILCEMNIDVNDLAGSLENWEDEIKDVMIDKGIEEEDITLVSIREYTHKVAVKIWKDTDQGEEAVHIAWGRGDARKYAMKYDGWIRVAGHGFECWEMTQEVLKRMGDGLYDALGEGEEVDDEEIFEIYVHKTGMHYTDVPWHVINGGDPGALRVYGTKNNPKRRRRK